MNNTSLFDPFSGKDINNFMALANRAKSMDMSLDDILENYTAYLESKRNPSKKQQQAKIDRCPSCGFVVRTLPVNSSPSTQVGGGYTHVKLCMNKKCLRSEYI